MASAGGHWAKVAQGNIGVLVFVPAGQSAAQAITGRKPQGGGFPASVGDVQVIKGLGGSTGAKLVQDENGNLYVMKKGNNPGHLLEESAADKAYQSLGLDVPDHKIYQTPGGPVKLAKYVEGKTLDQVEGNNPGLAAKAHADLRKGFVADAVLGNWDVIGLGKDNVLVGKNGTTYRIDNGGSLRYRAQGAKKDSFDQFPNEIWSMRTKGSAASVYGKMTFKEVATQALALTNKAGGLQKVLPPEITSTVYSRMNRVFQLGRAYEVLSAKGIPDAKIEGFVQKLWSGLKAGTVKIDPKNEADMIRAYNTVGG